ncbi:MAG: GNAT family N-acetyltransferase [Anaerolineales bacterium]|nr:GNAT family N-acetyltransferase [Chloroflexota bacterium]MBL6981296.1 GNAT family N-acetyltransferase [Anaerolineales bacterium]
MNENRFSSERLCLRAFEPDDVTVLHAYLNHPSLTGRRYIPWSHSNDIPLSLTQVETILEKWGKGEKQFHLAVVSSGNDKVIGHANCDWGWDPHCPHISLVIAPDYQRQGYGSEVFNLILRYLYENTHAHNVAGGMNDWNQTARAFAQKHGFKETGKMRRAGLRNGEFYDWIGVDILRPEWQALEGA